VRIDGNLRFPNGIAVLHTDDGRPSKLIVAETPTKLLWQYDIKGAGEVGERSVWGKLPGMLSFIQDKDNFVCASSPKLLNQL
jgi:sugar lactone lactonase YvrE